MTSIILLLVCITFLVLIATNIHRIFNNQAVNTSIDTIKNTAKEVTTKPVERKPSESSALLKMFYRDLNAMIKGDLHSDAISPSFDITINLQFWSSNLPEDTRYALLAENQSILTHSINKKKYPFNKNEEEFYQQSINDTIYQCPKRMAFIGQFL